MSGFMTIARIKEWSVDTDWHHEEEKVVRRIEHYTGFRLTVSAPAPYIVAATPFRAARPSSISLSFVLPSRRAKLSATNEGRFDPLSLDRQ
jgi:hypothetical protein